MSGANVCPSCGGQTRVLSEPDESNLFWGVESPLDALNVAKIGFTLFKNITNTISSAVEDKSSSSTAFTSESVSPATRSSLSTPTAKSGSIEAQSSSRKSRARDVGRQDESPSSTRQTAHTAAGAFASRYRWQRAHLPPVKDPCPPRSRTRRRQARICTAPQGVRATPPA